MDHFEQAAKHADSAETYANRDGISAEHREQLVSYNVRMAQVHATIAVAQRLDAILGHFEDRTVAVEMVRE